MYRNATVIGEGKDIFGAKGFRLLFENGKEKVMSKDLVRLLARIGKLNVANIGSYKVGHKR